MKLLCLDFGNTRFKYAIFDGAHLVEKGFISLSEAQQDLAELYAKFELESCILSSVVHHDAQINDWLRTTIKKVHLLGVDTRINFSTASIKRPIDIGADRLALCASAVALGSPASYKLIISAGTCITYNFLSIDDIFLGGAISPGVGLRYTSMHEHTALLPLLRLEDALLDPPLIGYDTETHLHSGVLYGVVDEIDGMIRRYREVYDRLEVYFTGGYMANLLPQIKSSIFAEPDLLMHGLRVLAYKNL